MEDADTVSHFRHWRESLKELYEQEEALLEYNIDNEQTKICYYYFVSWLLDFVQSFLDVWEGKFVMEGGNSYCFGSNDGANCDRAKADKAAGVEKDLQYARSVIVNLQSLCDSYLSSLEFTKSIVENKQGIYESMMETLSLGDQFDAVKGKLDLLIEEKNPDALP